MSSTKNRGIAAASAGSRPARHRWLTWGIVAVVVAIVLVALYGVFTASATSKVEGAGPSYDIGEPGPGQLAPDFTLTDNTGKQVSLKDYEGKNVLLYFQEGLTCQPCWDQLTSLEQDATKLKTAGVDAVLSITTDPANQIAVKTQDMGLSTPVLSDPDLSVSTEYHANQFGMMGNSRDGHSFILVGPDGTIRWRADYGGAPNYTMYLPVDTLLNDLKTGV